MEILSVFYVRGKLTVHRDLLRSVQIHSNLFELSKSTASRAHTLTWTAKELIRCHVTVHVSEGNGGKKKKNQGREMGEDQRRCMVSFPLILSR